MKFYLSKAAERREFYTAVAEVEEDHYTLPRRIYQRLRRINKGLKSKGPYRLYGDVREKFMQDALGQYREHLGVKRTVKVRRIRFLIGQYLDRSKYRGDGSLVSSPINGDGSKKDVAL